MVGKGFREMNVEISTTWHLVCKTFSQWETLVETLTSAEARCEKDLARLLKRNFLTTIKALFDEKVWSAGMVCIMHAVPLVCVI